MHHHFHAFLVRYVIAELKPAFKYLLLRVEGDKLVSVPEGLIMKIGDYNITIAGVPDFERVIVEIRYKEHDLARIFISDKDNSECINVHALPIDIQDLEYHDFLKVLQIAYQRLLDK